MKRILKYLNGCYTIGFIQNTLDGLMNGEPIKVRFIKHNYKDRWFADPFIIEVNDSVIVLLVEEFLYSTNRGRIARLTIDRRSYKLIKNEPSLDITTHLSFPVVSQKNGKIFIYPESGQSGKLTMYEYNMDTNSCVAVETLCNENLADAVITTAFDKEYLFCTRYPQYSDDELCIYIRQDNGKFQLMETISFNGDLIGRMAGDFFQYNGEIYRPAQDCKQYYGHKTVLQKVKHVDNKWEFEEIRRYKSPSFRYNLSMHTLNIKDGVMVVDASGYRNPVMGRIVKRLLDLYIKIRR